ncbi:hypothetical protein CRE_31654, partial [Caenorhabditis remanei]
NEYCVRTVVRLLEARHHLERAFDLLFEQLEKNKENDERMGELNFISSKVKSYPSTAEWLDETMKFCSRQSTKDDNSDRMMRVFQFISKRAAQVGEDSEKQAKIDESLRVMCRQILATGTRYAKQLVDQLLDSPSFSGSSFIDNGGLIMDILSSCDYEAEIYQEMIYLIREENLTFAQKLELEVSRRAPLMYNSQCITCEQPMNKSGYVFRCGHFQHIECSTSIERICTCDGIADRLVVPREKPDKPNKRDIFKNWESKLNCRALPK